MDMDRAKLEKAAKEVDGTAQKIIMGMKVLGPVMRTILPRPLSDTIGGRKCARVAKTRRYFLRFTDRWTRVPFEDLAVDLFRINRFLQLQLIGRKTEKEVPNDGEDPIFILYHGNAPEVMLDIIKFTSDPEFAIGGQSPRVFIYLAIENLTCFLYKGMPTLVYLPEKMFRDLNSELKDLLMVLHDSDKWLEGMAAVRMLGAASFHSYSCRWFNKNRAILEVVCRHMYRGRETVEEKIKAGEVSAKRRDDDTTTLLLLYQNVDDLVAQARLVGTLTCSFAVCAFYNITKWSMTDLTVYLNNSQAIRKADVFSHFSYIARQLVTWPNPAQFLNYFLFGIRRCLDMEGATDDLFIKNLSHNRKQGIPQGIESLKHWSHPTIRPTVLGWLICHALSLNDVLGACASIQILTHALTTFREPAVSTVIETIGSELMDLAHLVKYTTEFKEEVGVDEIPVQTPILEALLRHGRVPYFVHDTEDTIEGTMKPASELPDYCLEAALYCRRAALEEVMPLTEKQRRVSQADMRKEQGNLAFKAGRYLEAIELYTEALSLCPLSAQVKQALYYSNRAECFLRCNDPLKAIHDCNRSLCLDRRTMVKVQWRRSRAYQKRNLIYPAWVDMKCIEEEWNLTREQTRVNFQQLLSELSEEVGVMSMDLLSEVDQRVLANYGITATPAPAPAPAPPSPE